MARLIARITTGVLAAAVVAVFAAIALRWWGRAEDAGPADRPAIPDSLAFSQSPPSPPRPMVRPERLADPRGADVLADQAGIVLLDADPAGLPVPPGATRLSAARQVSPAGVREQGRYLASGSVDAVESWYAGAFAEAGWQGGPLAGRDDSPGRRKLLFGRAATQCWLELTPAPGGTERTAVAAVIFQMAPSSQSER